MNAIVDGQGFPVVQDSKQPTGMVAYQSADGKQLCAACLCPIDRHCKVCGCLTNKGADDECRCAKAIEAIPTCDDCGREFPFRWQLQVHRMPSPRCRASAIGAAGRYFEPRRSLPPLTPKGRN